MNTKHHRPRRTIICEVCGQQRRTWAKNRDVCEACLHKEPTTQCRRCKQLKRQVSKDTGFCPRCTELVSRLEGTCSLCNHIKVIFNQQDWLCQTCNNARHRINRRTERGKVKCSQCEKPCSSILVGRDICLSCWLEERNGYKQCKGCNKQKIIINKTECLCKQCDENRLASEVLRKYVTSFSTLYLYNKIIFDLLTTRIDWKLVTKKEKQRFRSFGRFLQTHPLPQPLSWESIEEVLPKLKSTGLYTTKQIRSCLFDVGHLLAAEGQLESYEDYTAKCQALRAIAQAPEQIQSLLHQFAAWLRKQQLKVKSVQNYLETVSRFWLWCVQRRITSPEQVQAFLVNDYLQSLYWRWQCSKCQAVSEFDPCDRRKTSVCNKCSAVGFLSKVKRYSQETVRHQVSGLRRFFGWAKANKFVLFNPVHHWLKASESKILHYPFEVIEQLSRYIVDPQADPTEALTLYLMIFHGFTSWELRHTQYLDVLPLRHDILLSTLADAYYLVVPRPPISRGKHSPGRPCTRLDFPAIAVPWLKPLVERFEHQRQQRLKNPTNRYLLIAPGRSRHDKPVSDEFVRRTVRRASLRAIGAVCTPIALRITAAVMYADRAGGGILEWMGWGDQRAFFYTWGTREIIHPLICLRNF